MKNHLLIDGKKYLSTRVASRITGYSSDYIGQLSRTKKINSKLVGRSWYVEEKSLIKYKNLGLGELSKFRSSVSREPHFSSSFGKVKYVKFAAISFAVFALIFLVATTPQIKNVAQSFSQGANVIDSVRSFLRSFIGGGDTQTRVALNQPSVAPVSTTTIVNNKIYTNPTTYVTYKADTNYVDSKINNLQNQLNDFKNFQSRQTDAIYNGVGTSISNVYNTITNNLSGTGGGGSNLSTFTTGDLAEGSNLYFTAGRVVDSLLLSASTTFGGDVFATAFHGDGSQLTGISVGSTFSTSTTRGVFSATSSLSYDPINGVFGISTSTLGLTTSDIVEGTRLYYSTDRFDTRLAATTSLPNITTLAGLTSVGTITSGVWNGATIGDAFLTKSGNWTGTFDGQEGVYYLDRANHTGSQLSSTISDFTSASRGQFSNSSTGLTYNSSTGDTSLTSGYTIPLTASTTEWANKVSSQWTTSGSNVYYNTGNVGIGTTTPQVALHLFGAGPEVLRIQSLNSAGSAAKVELYNDTGIMGQFSSVGSTASGANLALVPNSFNVTGLSTGGVLIGASNASGVVRIFSGGAATSNERIRIDSTGNVGIGTTTPSSKLTVAGTATISGGPIIAAAASGAGTPGALQINNTGTTKGYTLGNGTWFTTAIPYLRPVDTDSTLSFDIMPNGNGGSSLIHVCGNDVVANNASTYECLKVGMTYGGYAAITTSAGGSGVYRDLVLQETGANVGIGTTTPGSKLDVVGAIHQGYSTTTSDMSYYLATNSFAQVDHTKLMPGISLFNASAPFGLDIGYSATSSRYRTRMFAPSTSDIAFSVSSANPTSQNNFSDSLVIRGDTGNVAIGTSSAAYKLDVFETANNGAGIRVANSNTSTGAAATVRLENNTGSFGSFFKLGSGYTTYKTLNANNLALYNSTSGDISILNDYASGKITLAAGASTSPALVVDSNSYVAIGTSSALYPLDITGAAGRGIHVSSAGADDGIYLGAASATNGSFSQGTVFNGTNWIAKGTTAGIFNSNAGSLRFYSDSGLTAGNSYTPTERMTLTTSGNFGVGSTTPLSTLSVSGKAGTNPFTIASSTGQSLLTVNQAGFLGLGTTSPSTILSITNPQAAEGLVIQEASGHACQNDDFMIRNTAGAARFGAGIDCSGNAKFTMYSSNNLTWSAASMTTAGFFNFTAFNPTFNSQATYGTALIINGVNGQTADIFQVQSKASGGVVHLDVGPTGNIAIGTTTASAKLSVQQAYGATTPLFDLASTTSSLFATSSVFRVNANGNVGIGSSTPAYGLSVAGTVGFAGLPLSTTGNYLCIDTTTNQITSGTSCTLSSARFKHNVENLNLGLSTVLALRPVTFNFNQGYGDNGETDQLGFVAEEANTIDPRLVPHDKDGLPSGFNYANYTAVLTKAIQEQQVQINLLKNATSTIQIATTTIVQEVSATTTAETIAQSSSFIEKIATSVKNLISSAGELIVSTVKGALAIFDRVEVKTAAVSQGLEMKDQATGTIYCVIIKNGEWDKRPGTCAETASATSTTPIVTPVTPVTNPPVVISTSTPILSTTTPALSTSTPPIVIETASSTPTITSTTTPQISTSTPPTETAITPTPEPVSVPEATPGPEPVVVPDQTPVSVDNTQ